MSKNLVILAAGKESLHRQCKWVSNENFDLMINYYGSGNDEFLHDAIYYERFKGTKFNIVSQLYNKFKDVIDSYNYIFIPDDDLYITAEDLNRFFVIVEKYNLQISQPSLIGWASLPITLHHPGNVLRYTNWVEIMCPCFSSSAFKKCSETFSENDTNWGIEWLWTKALDFPKDQIAIVDSSIIAHTRPCFFGDTYRINGNNFEKAYGELNQIKNKYNLSSIEHEVFSFVKKPDNAFSDLPSEDKFFPPVEYLKQMIVSLRNQDLFL